jgi:hypothetical protein
MRRVVILADAIIEHQCDNFEHRRALKHRERQKTPIRMRQEGDDRTRSGRRMYRTCGHRRGDSATDGKCKRPDVVATELENHWPVDFRVTMSQFIKEFARTSSQKKNVNPIGSVGFRGAEFNANDGSNFGANQLPAAIPYL